MMRHVQKISFFCVHDPHATNADRETFLYLLSTGRPFPYRVVVISTKLLRKTPLNQAFVPPPSKLAASLLLTII